MNDREFLCWLHERLEHVHGDNPLEELKEELETSNG